MHPRRLENKVALITGAAGGMGSACARAYAQEGAALILVGLNEDGLQSVTDQVSVSGGQALVAAADVSDEALARAAVERGLQHFGQIDILVNAAGAQGPGAPVWEVDPLAWRTTIDVNLWGTFLMCRLVLPTMINRRYGRVINVSSGAGNNTMPFFSGYSASKAGVNHFTRTIAEELKPYGITANAMGVRGITPMWKDVLEAEKGGITTASIRTQVAEGMAPEVEENMPVFVFLACDEARHVTGQYIEANSLPYYLLRHEE